MTVISPDWTHELALVKAGADVVLGFDEVGRGALAGPVMVGCSAFFASHIRQLAASEKPIPPLLRDSKMLTPAERERLFTPLSQWADAWAIGASTNKEIDTWGISHALGIAALRALVQVEAKLAVKPGTSSTASTAIAGILDGPYDYITPASSTLDAPTISVMPSMTTVVKGDAHCATAACASCLAKVVRDRLMVHYAHDPKYQKYDWAENKGYGTKAHRAAIAKFGPSDLHRLSWHLTDSRAK
jgi:ribonuclease HII